MQGRFSSCRATLHTSRQCAQMDVKSTCRIVDRFSIGINIERIVDQLDLRGMSETVHSVRMCKAFIVNRPLTFVRTARLITGKHRGRRSIVPAVRPPSRLDCIGGFGGCGDARFHATALQDHGSCCVGSKKCVSGGGLPQAVFLPVVSPSEPVYLTSSSLQS